MTIYDNTLVILYNFRDETKQDITHVITLEVYNGNILDQKDLYIDGILTDSILINDTLYIITSTTLDGNNKKLPHLSYEYNGTDLPHKWHYVLNINRDVKFMGITLIDMLSNKTNHESFIVGRDTVSYITPNHIYLIDQKSFKFKNDRSASTRLNERYYAENKNFVALTYNDIFKNVFFVNITKLFPNETQNNIDKILNSNTSNGLKLEQINHVLSGFYNSLNDREKETIINHARDILLEEFQKPVTNDQPITIHKLGIEGTDITYIATNKLSSGGSLINQNAINEYNDKLRIVTTTTTEMTEITKYDFFVDLYRKYHIDITNVYVLDEYLNIIDKMDNNIPARYTPHFYKSTLYLLNYNSLVVNLTNMSLVELERNPFGSVTGYIYKCDTVQSICIHVNRDINIINMSNPKNPIISSSVLVGEGYSIPLKIQNDYKSFYLDDMYGVIIIPYSIRNYVEQDLRDGFKIYNITNYIIEELGFITHKDLGVEWRDFDYNGYGENSRSFIIHDTIITLFGMVKIHDLDLQEIKILY